MNNKNTYKKTLLLTLIITAILITSGFGVAYAAPFPGSNTFGSGTTASGTNSAAFGHTTTASGGYATSFGIQTTASGTNSAAFGIDTTAQPFTSFVIGQYNEISGTRTSWIDTEPLFVIGNGDLITRHNAVTVLKNGNMGIGISAPTQPLQVAGIIESTTSGFKFPDGTTQTTANAYVGDITSVTAGTGLNGGGTTGDVTLNIDTTSIQNRVTGTCPAGESIRIINADGTVTCQVDNSTTFWMQTGNDINYNTGNIGIGVSAPTAKLVLDTGVNDIFIGEEVCSTGYPGIQIGNTIVGDCSRYTLLGNGNDVFLNAPNDGKMYFRDNNGDNMMIDGSSGNVGIGTISPESKLHVKGPGIQRILVESTDNQASIELKSDSTNSWVIYSPSGTDDLSFWDTMNRVTFKEEGNVGIGTTSPSQRLDINGNGIANQWLTHSSQKWKTDISPLDNTLDKITQIQGVTYQWRANEFPEMSFDDTATQIGFIAEQLELIYPELVFTTPNGDKSVDYSKLTPILVEAIKEQQDTLEDLKAVICPEHQELSACQ